MTYRTAGATVFANTANNAIACTVPTGTISTDTVLVIVAWSNAAGGTVTVSGASTVVAVRTTDNNLGWVVLKLTGATAGGTITVNTALTTSANKQVKLLVFDADIGVVGSIGKRTVTQTFQIAPALTVGASAVPICVLALERSTATATTVSSVVASGGETVSQLHYETRDGDPDVGFYLGRFTSTSDPTSTSTITFNQTSTNGVALLFAEQVVAPVTPSTTPTFSIAPAFTATIGTTPVTTPTFSIAPAFTATVPAGVVATDVVYLLVAWGSPTTQACTITAPSAAVSSAAVVLPPQQSGNSAMTIVRMTGLVAGNIVTTAMSGAGGYVAKLFVFDKALGPSGLLGKRSGTSLLTVIPAVATVASKPVYLFAIERTLADGTSISAVSNANGTTVTQLTFDEYASDPDLSIYCGRVIPPTTDSGATTITYTAGSGNGAGVAFPALPAPAAVAPVFSIKPSFAVARPLSTGLVRAYLGRPDPDAIRVTTRTSGASLVRLAVSTSAAMTLPVLSDALAPDSGGYSTHKVGGLTADSVYYWQVQLDGVATGTVNPTRTWPRPGVPLAVAGLLAGACTAGFGLTSGPSNPDTFGWMQTCLDTAGVKPRLWVDLGDDIYPCQNGSPNGMIMPEHDLVIRNWWEAQHVQTQRQAFHKAIPTAHTYSDNDFVGSNSDSTRAPVVGALVNSIRRQILCDGPFGSTDGVGLYWSALLGRVLLVHTDGRSYSSDVLLPNSTPGKTMLGATQKAWLKAQFARVDHAGIIWFHDNQWVGGPTVSTTRPAVDNWQAFSAERQEIADYIVATKTKLLLYVHGDNHGMAYDNGLNNTYGHFPWVMVAPVFQDAQTVILTTSGDSYPDHDVTGQKYFTHLEIQDNGVTVTVIVRGINVTSGVPETLINGAIVSSGLGTSLQHEFFGTISATDVR
jgi:alkaline phosphatase D